LRSASCFAFIALRRASVSMVLPAETEKPALALALKACRSFGGPGVGGRQRVFAGGNLELSAYQMRINIRRARVDGGLARARTVRTDPHHGHARKDIESFEVTGRSLASLASSGRRAPSPSRALRGFGIDVLIQRPIGRFRGRARVGGGARV